MSAPRLHLPQSLHHVLAFSGPTHGKCHRASARWRCARACAGAPRLDEPMFPQPLHLSSESLGALPPLPPTGTPTAVGCWLTHARTRARAHARAHMRTHTCTRAHICAHTHTHRPGPPLCWPLPVFAGFALPTLCLGYTRQATEAEWRTRRRTKM